MSRTEIAAAAAAVIALVGVVIGIIAIAPAVGRVLDFTPHANAMMDSACAGDQAIEVAPENSVLAHSIRRDGTFGRATLQADGSYVIDCTI